MRPLSLFPALAVAALAACGTGDAKAVDGSTAVATVGADSGARPASDSASPAASAPGELPVVRALYVNRFAAMSTRKMRNLIAVADSTEINAFVIDVKDEFGSAVDLDVPELARNAGTQTKIRNIRALLDTLEAHDILPIARMVVFKDSVTARNNPSWTIRKADNSIWRDHEGLAWVNPYNRDLWEYNLRFAEEMVKLGFREIQFDYIRFPEPYKSLPQQVFPDNKGQSKPDAIAEFLKTANARLDKLGVHTTADIFGLVTTVKGPLEVAQEWEKLAPVTDVLLPMVYPSHYPSGSFGVRRPNAEPYKIIFTAIAKAHERNQALDLAGRENVRPWLQAFSLGQPKYDASHLREQKRAVYDAGYDGWVLWSPGSNYDIYLSGLDKTLTSQKKAWTGQAPKLEE